MELLHEIRQVQPGQRALVAIDGMDGAGKTVLAGELVRLAAADGGRPVSQVSIDGFHNPREVRYANGRGPESFFRSSYNYASLLRSVVEPYKLGHAVVPSVWDVFADAPTGAAPIDLAPDGLLLIEGIFLHRRELAGYWDASVWVDVPFSVSVPRGNDRFAAEYDPDPDAESNSRYVGGQRLYFDECAPWTKATWVFDNRDLDHPTLTKRS